MIQSHVGTFAHFDWKLVCPVFQILVWFEVLVTKQIWIFCKRNIFFSLFLTFQVADILVVLTGKGWRTKSKTQNHEGKVDLHCSIHVRVTKQAATMDTAILVILWSVIHAGLLPSLVLRMTLMISVGSRVSSSACWAVYCSTHCTWGQSETHTQRRKKLRLLKDRQSITVLSLQSSPQSS